MDPLFKNDPIYKFLKKSKVNKVDTYIDYFGKSYEVSHPGLRKNEKLNLQYTVERASDIGKRILHVDVRNDVMLTPKQARELIIEAKSFDRRIKNAHFYVNYGGNIHHALERCGAKDVGKVLYATVADGRKALAKIENKKVKIKRPKESDIDELIELEYQAHRRSSTSRVGNISKKMVRQFYQMMIQRKCCYVAYVDGRIAGVIGPAYNKMKIGFIMTIAVHPDFQGQGISKVLYKYALDFWSKKNIEIYAGTSTTTEVLGLGRKLKRVPLKVHLEI
ncbi:GNAT family N-acetyltransferase [Bacteriovorax sp. Seq25_V]|uniref:GNAT family N-acetyltransferase n=1 Tax=Bacteriovorax sp. Seq25_V TaxID=1201288 RepID=UPI00038A11CE|nr:GNAT family N-acetyltransferase [Bacteriovorax sp. Seq25_V]EQC47496.1 acetyltransferase, GNAT family [Bacteriovorax sp. Seq25_V]